MIVSQSSILALQLPTDDFSELSVASEKFAVAGIEERGAIFTRREVVEFILDLVGYTVDKPLHQMRILEPSFGDGDFLLPLVERLLLAYRETGYKNIAVDLVTAVRAVELHRDTFERTSKKLHALLVANGVSPSGAHILCNAWLTRDDFLLTPINETFTHIVGNPPYVRQELIPQNLMDEYRRRYSTVFDRADIYIPFIERSLRLLARAGVVGFICADRWMKNRYGGPLRKFVADSFHLRTFVDMTNTPAFHSEVIAYPAIFVIENQRGGATRIASQPLIESAHLAELARTIAEIELPALTNVKEVSVVAQGSEPWMLHSFDQLGVVRRLESEFPTLEEAGCKVGIGVATGADKAFIGKFDSMDVESDRKLPLVMTRDILDGEIKWRGFGVINPFADEGGLVSLDEHPMLRQYLEARRSEIAGRHVARKAPANWYRTIDRIYPQLVGKPKLLIPDIKGDAHIVYDAGNFYPHHNLYYITSETWDLRALQAVLLSGIARLFVAAYSTKMRGGYLRFQAQYLRRIRVPHWRHVSCDLRQRLIDAGRFADRESCNAAVAELYGLAGSERALLYARENA